MKSHRNWRVGLSPRRNKELLVLNFYKFRAVPPETSEKNLGHCCLEERSWFLSKVPNIQGKQKYSGPGNVIHKKNSEFNVNIKI
jgi:hypothetical protein